MSDLPNDDRELLNSIALTVQDTSVRLGRVEETMATKADLERVETTLGGEIEQVHLRLDSIEKTLSTRLGQVEADLSRLRSALYLLAKDRPEILRLLGQQ